ncbi:MAG: hypothetical protein ACM3ON_05775 [Chloroflexota bacterium]
MRFLLYDSVCSIEKGRTIVGTKTFSLSEEYLRGHYSKDAIVPGLLLIEAMAQLLGWLIIVSNDFVISTFLALLDDVWVPPRLRPGFRADIRGEIIATSRRDSLGKATVSVDGEVIAAANRIIYGHIDRAEPDRLRGLFRYYSGWAEPL